MVKYQGLVITNDSNHRNYYYYFNDAGRWTFNRDVQRERLYGFDVLFSHWFAQSLSLSGVENIAQKLWDNDKGPLYVWGCSVVESGEGLGVRGYAFGERSTFELHVISREIADVRVVGSEWFGWGVRLDSFLRMKFVYQQRALRNPR